MVVECAHGLRQESESGNESESGAEKGANGVKDSWNLVDHAGFAGYSLNVIDSEASAASAVIDLNVNEASASANGLNANCENENGSHGRR